MYSTMQIIKSEKLGSGRKGTEEAVMIQRIVKMMDNPMLEQIKSPTETLELQS